MSEPATIAARVPARILLKRAKGWRMPEGAVKVDRSTGFGNPFPVMKCTSTSMGVTRDSWSVGTFEGPAMWFKDTKAEAVALSVAAYASWLSQPKQENLRTRARLVLRGKDLACWCPLKDADGDPSPCHADVLLELANTPETQG